MADKNNLILFMERPVEPVFMAKGDNRTVFDIPGNFLIEKYQPIGEVLSNRFGESANKVTIKNITPPNLDFASQLGLQEGFSVVIPSHGRMAASLIDIFMKAPTIDDLQSLAAYIRDRVNPFLFNYSFSVALMHRQDTRDIRLPNFAETFPEKFMDSGVFLRARQAVIIEPVGSRQPILIPLDYTATDQDPEHRVAYFREDLGINLHHWHWHLVYPITAVDRSIVAKDRRGELFYYMHRQIQARYNVERFCNNLPEVIAYRNLGEAIPEGYFPKLDSLVASRGWPPRFVNTPLSDINRPRDNLRQDIQTVQLWISRITTAIRQGFVIDSSGRQIPLTEDRGIDILGDLVEASMLSVNPDFYGNLHVLGHVLIGFAHDPDGRFLEGMSVMTDNATAMRDPAFYRWHEFIDEVFTMHKDMQRSYSMRELDFEGVSISSVEVVSIRGVSNQFQTFWEQSDINLSRGLDFAPSEPVYVRFTHLQHEPFTYRIRVLNSSPQQRIGTVRIFMAPILAPNGSRMTFEHQRKFMIELDKFRVNLSPGSNQIIRRSEESSVTIPYERTFRNLDTNRPANNTQDLGNFNFCGCGWPQHMLIPKGTTSGYQMELFVMISDYAMDRIDQNLVGTCNDADSYCGVRDRFYPDRRSMGFPFDRRVPENIVVLGDFLTPNMFVQPCSIVFSNRTTVRAANNAVRNP